MHDYEIVPSKRTGNWVLGLDISSTITGWAIVSPSKKFTSVDQNPMEFIQIEHYGTIRAHGSNLHERIWTQYQGINQILNDFQEINGMAVEESYFSTKFTKAFKALMKTHGAAVIAARQHHIAVRGYSPAEARRITTGSGNISKKQGRTWIENQFKNTLKQNTTDDETDAIIIALAHQKTLMVDHISIKKSQSKPKFYQTI